MISIVNTDWLDACELKIRSYIHDMKLQVTKAQKIDQMGSIEKNECGWDACNLKMQSYIYGAEKKGKLIQMTNKTNTYNMMNKQFTPSAQLKSINVEFSNKAQLGRPVDPNSKRQQRLATAPGKKTGRPVDPTSARQKRLAEQAARAAANGGVVKRGRPVDPNSARQIALREAAAKLVAEQSWSQISVDPIAARYRFDIGPPAP